LFLKRKDRLHNHRLASSLLTIEWDVCSFSSGCTVAPELPSKLITIRVRPDLLLSNVPPTDLLPNRVPFGFLQTSSILSISLIFFRAPTAASLCRCDSLPLRRPSGTPSSLSFSCLLRLPNAQNSLSACFFLIDYDTEYKHFDRNNTLQPTSLQHGPSSPLCPTNRVVVFEVKLISFSSS
jgi:hypothetical protein